MECNKEEAVRAKGIAEKKMQNKDFVGARKVAIKAQQLFPELDNISQMLTVCNVHCSAEVKVSGSEMDWYGILQLDQTADETSIKKQYRKLALLLHPDKNKFSGAEAAFKLIGEAHRVLTDQAKRSLYDIKRRANVRTAAARQPPPHMNRNSYPRRQQGAQNNSTNHATSNFSGANQQQGQSVPTFWTLCPFCGIRYQYYRTIVNRALRCQNCQQSFIAYDINVQGTAPGANPGYAWNQSANPQPNEVPNQGAHNMGWQGNAGNASSMGFHAASEPFSKRGSNADFGGGAQNKATEDGEMNRRAHMGKPSENASRKRGRRMVVEESSESCDSDSTTDVEDLEEEVQNVEVTSSRYPRRSTRQKQHVTYKEDRSDDDDFVNPPSSKRSRGGGSSAGANDQSDEASSNDEASSKDEASFEDEKEAKHKGSVPSEESLPNGKERSGKLKKSEKEQTEVGNEESFKPKDNSEANPTIDSRPKATSTSNSIPYLAAEFNDFENDRMEGNFDVDQIWALYDDSEGLPRFYARIRKVFSPEFKLRITWLEALPNPEDQNEVNWFEEELPVACGNFRLGRTEVTDERGIFSHLASCEKGVARGTYKIYPKKGEVWALFKGWNINWSSDPYLHRTNKFEIVEVLSDYSDETGVEVSYVVKLKGFISLFRRCTNREKKPFQIPPNEILRFSHRIPHHRMTGGEREGVPEGSLELDPASVPHVTQESKSSTEKEVPATGSDKFKTPKMKVEPDMKNPLEKENPDCSVRSPRGVNGAHDKKEKNVNSGKKGILNDFPNTKHGEANATKRQADKKDKHLDGGNTSPCDAAECPNYSPAPPLSDQIVYPAPEFHDFEKNKSRDEFQPGQIWALYSDIDTLPKFYAQIKKVQSAGFEVHITWLEPCSTSEGEMQWANDDLPVSCGMFKLTRETEMYSETSVFSHQVHAGPTLRKGRFNIYPRKGEIWALYKDISTEWTRTDLKNCKYFMAEVLEDSGPKLCVSILEKVNGFNSVFKGICVTMEIARDRMLRFSHQVPAFRLTKERGGKLKGCVELDPAAVPPSFFHKTSK
ncbi:uncharacterized protein LOC131225765 [Magnolia sinica]|uniref:uncharacterized protein LOC131225765 n=1 Tax=Magnolia sinica TaxID=86752 RepID=UPI00265AF044|nr:uncharacterized protein LOC131225765 [Magnolia sinica]